MTYRLKNEEEASLFGSAFGAHLRGGDAVLLSGELGTGKSVLARGAARALGIGGAMPSPTFTIAIPYEGKCRVCHMDPYRLADLDEFYAIGLHEYLTEDYVALIEWPFPGLADFSAVEVSLSREGGSRLARLSLKGMGDRADSIIESLQRWKISA